MDLGGSPEKLRQGFVALAESLLTSLVEVFPECDTLDAGLQLFSRLIKGDAEKETAFIRECHAVLHRHGEALKNQEEEALFLAAEEMPLLRSVNLRQKWADPGFQEASKKHFWQYLTSLKIYADLFCSVPSEVLGKIETLASGLSRKLQGGEMDLMKLDVREIGNELLGQLSAEEVKAFEASLPSIFSSISEMASSVCSKAGGTQLDPEAIMKVLLEKQQDGSSLDVGSIMQSLGGALPLAGMQSPEAMASMMQLLGQVGAQGAAPRGPGAMLEDTLHAKEDKPPKASRQKKLPRR